MCQVVKLLSSLEASDWIALVAALVALFSLFVTVRSSVIQRRLENDKELLSQLVLTLERAFNAIAHNGTDAEPVRDRLAWLTAARHILEYRTLKGQLKTVLYKTLCKEHEEYWRHNFYLIFERIHDHQFYSWMRGNGVTKELIEPRSAAVLHRFSAWPEGRADPIQSVHFASEVEKGKLFSALFHKFRSYIEAEHPELYKECKE